MPTSVVRVVNQSPYRVYVNNVENPRQNFELPPGREKRCNIWISWHREKPLVISTYEAGDYSFWDKDWKIHVLTPEGREFVVLEGRREGVGGKVEVIVQRNGKPIIRKT